MSTTTFFRTASMDDSLKMNSRGDSHNFVGRSSRRQTATSKQGLSAHLPSLKCGDEEKSREESYSEVESYSSASGEASENENGARAAPSGSPAERERSSTNRIPVRAAETERSTWADLDLSIVLALVSPIGNWLTGGDHIKNILLVALLIFYLHQLIQVPWELYHSSRPRRPHPNHPPSEPNERIRKLAHTELRLHEFAYLTLAVLSPVLGAYLLRYILSSINGSDPLSWFSTTLFILATGLRPWSHLVSRLRRRTHDLHDAIHYPSADSPVVAQESLQTLLERVEKLERELKQLRSRTEGVEEAYDDLSGVLEDSERDTRRSFKRLELSQIAEEKRLVVVEKGLAILLDPNQGSRTQAPPTALSLVQKLWSLATFDTPPPAPVQRPSTPLRTPTRLETIMEDPDDTESDEFPQRQTKSRITQQKVPSPLFDYVAAVLAWPYRMSVNILATLILPLQKILM